MDVQNTGESTQSKVKESKVKESKVKYIKEDVEEKEENSANRICIAGVYAVLIKRWW